MHRFFRFSQVVVGIEGVAISRNFIYFIMEVVKVGLNSEVHMMLVQRVVALLRGLKGLL